jgi:hypothetical protein
MKSGYKTTEFWLAVFTNLLGVLVLFDVIGEEMVGPLAQVAAMIAMAIVNGWYASSRAQVKASGGG